MYITIDDVIGEKTIDLSYPIQNFNSSQEVAVVSMFSNNIQYKVTETFNLKLIDNSEKQILIFFSYFKENCELQLFSRIYYLQSKYS